MIEGILGIIAGIFLFAVISRLLLLPLMMLTLPRNLPPYDPIEGHRSRKTFLIALAVWAIIMFILDPR